MAQTETKSKTIVKRLVGVQLSAIVVIVFMLVGGGCETSQEIHRHETERRLMQMLANWWSERDGIAVVYLAPMLFEMSLCCPDAFYEEMAPDSAAFSDFLDALEPFVFTNLRDTTTHELEQKRINAIDELRRQQINPEYSQMQDEIVRVLEATRVRFID